jgi:hypothetical protein
MFNEQLRAELRKAEQTLVKVFSGANGGKLNEAQQLACLQYVHYLNDSLMDVFANPQVTSTESPHVEVQVPEPEPERKIPRYDTLTSAEGEDEMGFEKGSPENPYQVGVQLVEDVAPGVAPEVETAKVKEMTKDAVTVADGKEHSRAQQQEKDSGVGAKDKVKKK